MSVNLIHASEPRERRWHFCKHVDDILDVLLLILPTCCMDREFTTAFVWSRPRFRLIVPGVCVCIGSRIGVE
jgi:hypothetical protein